MCGRIARTSNRAVIVDELGVTRLVNVALGPRYNIAPSQYVEAVLRNGTERHLGPMQWGFASPHMPSTRAQINARAETVATSPLFRDAFRRHRCLVVADGFYEWQKDGKTKRPYFIRLRSGRPFGLAAIWAPVRQPAGNGITTCAIITCPPNELMVPIHDRMPVIVPAMARDRWLDPEASLDDAREVLVPLPAEAMEAYEVSTFVNSPAHDSPECVQPVVRMQTLSASALR